MRLTVSCLTTFLLLSTGCASLSERQVGDPDYAAQADENLRLGTEALEGRDFFKAEKYFEFVKTKFPYLEASKTAELRLADVDFNQDRFPEAREKYNAFIKAYPTHPQVDYAAYRVALSHVEDMPSDFFLLPPSEEKDQTEVQSALRALNDFLRQYPDSQYTPQARVQADDAKRRLAEHELYVAAFYRKRERWRAVAQRLEGMLSRYPGTKYEESALFSLHEAYVKLKEPTRAQETLRQVIQRLPGTPAAERAQRMLGS
ncbi:outer membrane protein assembly factor BamD [Stigmatella sp. ncwal1]|uniref:Outer membrane protein assembly factor BamD n=1 Tax=Stigmatella ashevillensis TaxID=2995309 RepID=A0ABT5DQ02_9BACT|nr:outer membrane protein assembly factor BamD [Stigmatella ashevillena]MDC0714467.1 outer membrane protein assembly factor BamD [Stigmatella ashevillena]